ncbi:MAG: phosphate ABC transporter substrate-binding protein PstS family protein [candidate division Zixibacteria bacterium]|nr:phosphate ABC transporter substrate-binding protein PstS family protein [candidate division Zixibacteria bacterium]
MKCFATGLVACALVLVVVAGCGRKEADKVSIQIKGSDTEVNLVQRLAETFMEKNPEISMAVTGGGSGVGIAALVDKRTDIANSSRAMKDEEMRQAQDKDVNPVAIVFALDGLALITHQSLGIDHLTLDEVAKIFKGEITNWKELDGPDLAISLYGRQANSGTYIYLRDKVLKGDYAPQARRMNGNAQILEAVRTDKAAIGYVGIGYVVDDKGEVISGIKVLDMVKDPDSSAVTPLKPENVKSGLYPLTRPLYQYTDGNPKGKLLDFIQFELSQEGQLLVTKEGYYPLTPEYMESNRRSGIIK